MDDLILRSLQDDISDLDQRKLKKWRDASPENERHYRQLANLWAVDIPPALPGSPPTRPALGELIRKAETRRGTRLLGHPVVARGARWAVGIAAALATLIAASVLTDSATGPDESDFGGAEFVTTSTETATVTLSDGTLVRLAPNSRIRLPSGRGRKVWLHGRAYFAVEPDPSRPFTVHTRAGEALVLGTRFELRVQEDDLRLAVIEGRVALSAGKETVEVVANEISDITAGSKPSVVRVENISELLDWPGGLLVFQSTPFRQVGLEVERYFGTHVEITDTIVAQRKITGSFTGQSLHEVVTAICLAASARCSINANGILIQQKD